MRRFSASLAPCIALAISAGASAQDVAIESLPARWRLSFEEAGVDAGTDLGLFAVNLDFLSVLEDVPGVYAGLGVYSAVSGDRGGLFVGGVSAGWLREIARGWNVDAGLFAGGGGGGSGEEGSGAMLRPHVAIERALGAAALRLELARLSFPDGGPDSTHLALGVSLPCEVLTARDEPRAARIPHEALAARRTRVRAIATHVEPDGSSRRRDGSPLDGSSQWAGAGIDWFLTDWLYVPVELLGAAGGGIAGFALAEVGLGVRVPLAPADRLSFEASAAVGSGGGGDVDAGGGLAWSASAGLRTRLGEHLGLGLGWKHFEFPDGAFAADAVTASVEWCSTSAALARGYSRERLAREGLARDTAEVSTTRFAVIDKAYAFRAGARKQDGSLYEPAQLLGLRIEQPVAPHLALTGAAFTAWDGDVGAYAEGLFGVQASARPLRDRRHAFVATLEAGAGGGGGADVGSGLIALASAGYRRDLSRDVALAADLGWLESRGGSFDAAVFQIGLIWTVGHARLRR